MSGSNEKAQRANAGRNFHTFYKRNNSTIPGSIELARLRYFARGIHALSERALFEHMTPPKAAPAPASAVVIIIREDRRQRATRQRQVQVESMTRRASASCSAHSNLARAVHAALDCRRHLADANEPETRASFGRLVEAPVQAGHSAKDRSLSVRLSDKANDGGFVVFSFSGETWQEGVGRRE